MSSALILKAITDPYYFRIHINGMLNTRDKDREKNLCLFHYYSWAYSPDLVCGTNYSSSIFATGMCWAPQIYTKMYLDNTNNQIYTCMYLDNILCSIPVVVLYLP